LCRYRADLRRRGLAAFGQLADLGGDDRETPAVFARPRGLDRGVQSQQIGQALEWTMLLIVLGILGVGDSHVLQM
jgi:hypothetical protein